MTVERFRPANTQSTLGCLNEFWSYARGQGIFDYPDWQQHALQALIDAGETVWVYRRDSDSRIDGVCIYHLEQALAPGASTRALWMVVTYLAVRANTLGTTNERLRATFTVTKGAVEEGLRNTAAVGLTCNFEKNNADLKMLTDSFPNVVYEETAVLWRAWMRRAAFLVRFDQWVNSTGAAGEPIVP